MIKNETIIKSIRISLTVVFLIIFRINSEQWLKNKPEPVVEVTP